MSKFLSQTCRSCLFPLNAATNVPIFDEYTSNNSLAHMIAETIHILLDPADNLGENVCKICADKIYNFYEFRQMFLESEKKLREHLEQLRKNENNFDIIPIDSNYEFATDTVTADVAVCDIDDELENPITDSTNNLRWKCSKCPKAFGRRIELQLHRHIHRTDTHLKSTEQQPPQHQLHHHQQQQQNGFLEETMINIKSEPLTTMVFDTHSWAETSQSDPIEPIENGMEDMRWICNICKCRFLRRAHLRMHRRQHAGERKQPQPPAKKEIKKHIPQTILKRDHPAPISMLKQQQQHQPQKQQQQQQLKQEIHKKNQNTNGVNAMDRWLCKKCCIPFRTRRLLRDHNVIHRTNNTSYTSIGLNSTMNTTTETSSLDNDLSIIQANTNKLIQKKSTSSAITSPKLSAEMRWKCPKCRKSFDSQKSLKRHKMFSHTFEIKLNLKSTPKHISSATMKKSSQIDYINNKRTKQMNRSPFVERDWPCNSCFLVFNRRNALREHRRTAHMLKPNVLPLKEEQTDEDIADNIE